MLLAAVHGDRVQVAPSTSVLRAIPLTRASRRLCPSPSVLQENSFLLGLGVAVAVCVGAATVAIFVLQSSIREAAAAAGKQPGGGAAALMAVPGMRASTTPAARQAGCYIQHDQAHVQEMLQHARPGVWLVHVSVHSSESGRSLASALTCLPPDCWLACTCLCAQTSWRRRVRRWQRKSDRRVCAVTTAHRHCMYLNTRFVTTPPPPLPGLA